MKTLPSIGSLLDRGFELHFKNARKILSISALYLVGLIPFGIGVLLAPGKDLAFLVENGLVTPIETVGLFLRTVVSLPFHALLSFLVVIGIIIVSKELLEKREPTTKAVLKKLFLSVPTVFLVRLLQAIPSLLPVLAVIPGFLVVWLGVNSGASLVTVLGIFLFFLGLACGIAGILYIGIHLQFSQFAHLNQGLPIFDSLRKSRDLVKGRFFAVLFRLAIPKMIIYAGFFLSQLCIFLLITILFYYLPVSDSELLSKVADILARAIELSLFAIRFPLLTVTDNVLFHDLVDTRS